MVEVEALEKCLQVAQLEFQALEVWEIGVEQEPLTRKVELALLVGLVQVVHLTVALVLQAEPMAVVGRMELDGAPSVLTKDPSVALPRSHQNNHFAQILILARTLLSSVLLQNSACSQYQKMLRAFAKIVSELEAVKVFVVVLAEALVGMVLVVAVRVSAELCHHHH